MIWQPMKYTFLIAFIIAVIKMIIIKSIVKYKILFLLEY